MQHTVEYKYKILIFWRLGLEWDSKAVSAQPRVPRSDYMDYISSHWVAPFAARLCLQKQPCVATSFLELGWEGHRRGHPIRRLETFAWKVGHLRNPRQAV